MIALMETTLVKMAHLRREWSPAKLNELTFEQSRLLDLILNLNQQDAAWADYADVWAPEKISGIDEAKLMDLFRYDTSIHFTPAEKALVHFAYLAAADRVWVADLQLLRAHFTETVVNEIKAKLAERDINLKKRKLRLIVSSI